MRSIPHANEGFWNSWFEDEPWIGDEYRTYVGSPPYLSTQDGSSSHLAIERFFGQTLVYIGVTLVPFVMSGPGRVSVQGRTIGATNPTPHLYEVLLIDKTGTNYLYAETTTSSTGDWETFSIDIPAVDLAPLAAPAAAGQLMLLATGPVGAVLPSGAEYQVSWIDFSLGSIPLRLRQRGDGLGMGGPRLFGRGSRQRSPRARGYL